MDIQKKYGQYFTPKAIVHDMISTIVDRICSSSPIYTLSPSDLCHLRVLDPAVGDGGMLCEWCRHIADKVYAHTYGRRNHIVGARILDKWEREGVVLEAAEESLWDDAQKVELYQPLYVDYDGEEEWISSWDVSEVYDTVKNGDVRETWEYKEIVSGIALQCYGVDIDERCVTRTRERLADMAGLSPDDFENTIFCDDFLFLNRSEIVPLSFDVVIMNPPYLGGGKISGTLGDEYRKRLKKEMTVYHGRADLCAYFLQRAYRYAEARKGMISFVATNSVNQGKTREVGLKVLVDYGFRIYNAQTNIPWPGDANVTVHIVHLDRYDKDGE